MLLLLFYYISSILCSDKSYVQTLVFGIDETNSHFCDFQLSPADFVSNVTIFRVVDGDQDKAVPCCTVVPYASTNASNFSRIDIPDYLVKGGVEYSFLFEILGGGEAYSESWTLDEDKGVFAVSSSITKKFWKNRNFLIIAGVVGVLAGAGALSVVYRKIKKSRNVL